MPTEEGIAVCLAAEFRRLRYVGLPDWRYRVAARSHAVVDVSTASDNLIDSRTRLRPLDV
jgi:hypothetical protein